MRRLPAAVFRSWVNCRSVACSAESGMLLMRPIVSTSSTALRPGSNRSASRRAAATGAGLTICRCLSNSRAMPGSGGLFRCLLVRVLRTGLRQRLVDIFDDVADVLDADREADGLRQRAGLALLLRRHL